MKIFICAIMKDEEKNLHRFYNSCKDADGIYILDTGSTDKSVEVAKSLGPNVHVSEKKYDKFRFDTARNDAIELLPKEDAWVIHLDIDEFLVGDWQKELQSLEKTNITNVRYMYVFNYVEGKIGTHFLANKITRNGLYKFKYPIHETIHPLGPHNVYNAQAFRIDQIQDTTKTRDYMERLEDALKVEYKGDQTLQFYLLKEYFIKGRYGHCIDLAKEMIQKKSDLSMVAALIAARTIESLSGDVGKKEEWLLTALELSPFRREPYMELMRLYQSAGLNEKAFWAGVNVMNINYRHFDFIEMAEAWTNEPHLRFVDICHALGYRELARKHFMIANDIMTMRGGTEEKGLKDFIDGLAGDNLAVVELGSYTGESTVIFANSDKIKTVYAVDPWKDGEVCEYVTFKNMNIVEQMFDERTANNTKITKMKKTGEEALSEIEAADVVYIDAIHTYEAVKKDISMWFDKVKNGGYIGGHDYQEKFPGVVKAVDEFCKEKKLGSPQKFIDNSWLVRVIK